MVSAYLTNDTIEIRNMVVLASLLKVLKQSNFNCSGMLNICEY